MNTVLVTLIELVDQFCVANQKLLVKMMRPQQLLAFNEISLSGQFERVLSALSVKINTFVLPNIGNYAFLSNYRKFNFQSEKLGSFKSGTHNVQQ